MIDYMVMEAVSMKIREEDRKTQEKEERKAFKKDTSKLNQYR